MKIGDFYVDNTAFGVAALIVSILTAWFAYPTNLAMLQETKKTADANKRMADANEGMLTESRRMSDANQRMAQSNEEMVGLTRSMERNAAQSARRAEAEAAIEAGQREEASKARFKYRTGTRTGETINASLENWGNHHADNAKATIHWNGRQIGAGEGERVRPGQHIRIGFAAPPDMISSPDDRFVTVRLEYEDGNGSQE